MFIEPMYALPIPNLQKKPKAKPFILEPGLYSAEEKIDGIRIITEISDNSETLFVNKGVTAWSRYGNLRPHPKHIEEQLAKLPNCIIDGELCAPGKRSYGTMDLDNTEDLVYYVFDIIRLLNIDETQNMWITRQEHLQSILSDLDGPVQLLPTTEVNTWNEIYALRDTVWARDGEGLILKRINSLYTPGKRPKNTWIKIKQLGCDPFTVIGFEASRGLKNNRGPYAMTKVRDREGIITQVKTKNDAQCRLFEERGKTIPHPDIGRILMCEYQERTPDGEYRHIRWDRWEDE